MPGSIYRIDPERDREFAEEFRRDPVGHHSPGLQRVLNVFRRLPLKGKHVLVCTKPHKEWQLATLSGEQGKPIQLVKGKVYRSLAEAERDVFRIRWRAVTGETLRGA